MPLPNARSALPQGHTVEVVEEEYGRARAECTVCCDACSGPDYRVYGWADNHEKKTRPDADEWKSRC